MFDQAKIRELHQEINAALDAVAAKHGLTHGGSRISYSTSDFKFTTNFADKAAVGDINPAFLRNLRRNGFLYGLDESHVGNLITIGSRSNLKFLGLSGKKAALQDSTGKVWVYDAALVAQIIKA